MRPAVIKRFVDKNNNDRLVILTGRPDLKELLATIVFMCFTGGLGWIALTATRDNQHEEAVMGYVAIGMGIATAMVAYHVVVCVVNATVITVTSQSLKFRRGRLPDSYRWRRWSGGNGFWGSSEGEKVHRNWSIERSNVDRLTIDELKIEFDASTEHAAGFEVYKELNIVTKRGSERCVQYCHDYTVYKDHQYTIFKRLFEKKKRYGNRTEKKNLYRIKKAIESFWSECE